MTSDPNTINLDEMNTLDGEEDVEIQYHEKRPFSTYSPKKGCISYLIPVIGFEDLYKGNTWRSGLIELIGTTLFVLGSCLIASGVARTGVLFPITYIAILHVFLFMFMISATAPSSGGHLNPMITMACACARVMSVTKACVYIACQCIGATIAGIMARIIVGEDIAETFGIGQCQVGSYPQEVGVVATFLTEFIFDFFLLFVTFGMVIDPKQGEKSGPIVGPLAISFIFCFGFCVSGLIRPHAGYGGAAMNPARCLGPALALYNIDNMWVWWVPAQVAAALHGVLYILVPPDHESLYSRLDTKRKKDVKM